MRKIGPIFLLILIVLIALMFGCASPTTITGSWKKPDSGENISSIMVTSLTSRVNARQAIETEMVKALQAQGMRGVRSFDVMPPTFTDSKQPDKEALLEKVKAANVDAILTVALIDTQTETRYVPGTAGYAPMTRFGYYGMFWGYYSNWYPTLYSPGYYEEDKTYFLESNLYDAKTQELLWSAQSETYNPTSLEEFSKQFADAVVAELKRDDVLHGKGSKSTTARR